MKKRIICLLAVLALALAMLASCGAEKGLAVTVTVVDAGEVKLARENVTVKDINGDGSFDIDEALASAHDEFCNDAGAYESAPSDYGLSLVKLWGDDSGCFGYYVNNASPASLADAVTDGDSIVAYVFADKEGWSDLYCWFDKGEASVREGEALALTLTALGFDENWNPVEAPLAGAKILVDGEATEFVTDENGVVTITGLAKGEHVITAEGDGVALVTPVMLAEVK